MSCGIGCCGCGFSALCVLKCSSSRCSLDLCGFLKCFPPQLWAGFVGQGLTPSSCNFGLQPMLCYYYIPTPTTHYHQPLLPSTNPCPYQIIYSLYKNVNACHPVRNKHFPVHILMFVLSRTHNLFHRFILKIKRFSSISLQSLVHVFCRAFVTNPSNLGQSPNRPTYHLV